MFRTGRNFIDGIEVDVVRKRIRRINIRISPDGVVHLSIPSWGCTIAEGEAFLPIHAGSAGKPDLGYVRDDTGENISSKNANYCELTALYWAWKNLKCDYLGLCFLLRVAR